MRIQSIFSSPVPHPAEEADFAIAAAPPPRQAAFPRFVETTAEILWAILLFLVIAFFLSKAPTLSAVFDDAASAMHRGGEPAVHPSEAQIRDLEIRMAADEHKLSTLERGYLQLKQRHSDLLRAYAELQESRLQRPGGSSPRAAAK
jgi:hypothetical protein